MRKVLLFMVGALVFAVGHTYAQDKPLVRYDEEAFEKVAKKVDTKQYTTNLSFSEKAFHEYMKVKGIKVNFTESDYKDALQAHDTCAASYTKLLKEKNNLLGEKTTIEAERDVYKTAKETLEAEKKSLTEERDAYKTAKETLEAEKKSLTEERDAYKTAKETLEAEKKSLVTERDAYKTAKETLEAEKKSLVTERDTYKTAKETLEAEKKSLTAEQDSIKSERDNLKQAQGNLNKVFDNAEAKINAIYENNKNKSLSEMKASDLKEATDTFEGIKSLIDFHPLQNGTKEKLNLINAWGQLKVALDEAVKYMEGKYDNNKRTACISSINKAVSGVTLGSKQLSEKESVLNALNEQATVNSRFNDLINYLINDFVVIPSKQDASDALALIEGKTIKNIDNSTKQIVVTPNENYHKKHVEALRELHNMMSEAATKGPNKNLQIEGDFRKTMESIRNKYQ